MDNSLHFSSGENENYTPISFLIRVCEFFGGDIDLDPCSNSLENPHCPARLHYTKALNGVELPWFGNVFVNPPYSRESLKPFVDKAIQEFEEGRAKQILVLVPARTDTKWHLSLKDYSRCYLTGRLKFENPANKGNSAPFPSVLFYMGREFEKFERYWRPCGEVLTNSSATPKPGFDRKAYQREYMRRKRQSETLTRSLMP